MIKPVQIQDAHIYIDHIFSVRCEDRIAPMSVSDKFFFCISVISHGGAREEFRYESSRFPTIQDARKAVEADMATLTRAIRRKSKPSKPAKGKAGALKASASKPRKSKP